MLVLSRERGEVIVIGGNIEIEIIDIRRDKVRVGVTAPKGISINRKEVQRLIDGGCPTPVKKAKVAS